MHLISVNAEAFKATVKDTLTSVTELLHVETRDKVTVKYRPSRFLLNLGHRSSTSSRKVWFFQRCAASTQPVMYEGILNDAAAEYWGAQRSRGRKGHLYTSPLCWSQARAHLCQEALLLTVGPFPGYSKADSPTAAPSALLQGSSIPRNYLARGSILSSVARLSSSKLLKKHFWKSELHEKRFKLNDCHSNQE